MWLSEDVILNDISGATPTLDINSMQGKYFTTNIFAKGEYIPE